MVILDSILYLFESCGYSLPAKVCSWYSEHVQTKLANSEKLLLFALLNVFLQPLVSPFW